MPAPCAVNQIDSNATELRVAVEECLGVLPANPVWHPMEPNSYGDFGGESTFVARTPIKRDRQKSKGSIVDVDASGSFVQDLTDKNSRMLLQGFLFAAERKQPEMPVTAVDVLQGYAVADPTKFPVNSIVLIRDMANSKNNRVGTVASVTATHVMLGGAAPVAEAASAGTMIRVGHKFDNLDVDNDDPAFPVLSNPQSTSFVDLGIMPGMSIFVGGMGASFQNAENNGFKHVRHVVPGSLTLDKSDLPMTDEVGASIAIFFGNFLKNESNPALIKQFSYQLERTLGSLDGLEPPQSEYLVGSVASELTINMGTADKITTEMSFLSVRSEVRTQAEGLKAGTRPELLEDSAYNTSENVKRLRLMEAGLGVAEEPLLGFMTECNITVNNTLTANKAIGHVGAFSVTAGTFDVQGQMEAYFSDVRAIQAIRRGADVTLDAILVKPATHDFSGIVLDMPLVTLGDGRLNVELDQPIKIPVSSDASSGAKVHPSLNHTLAITTFDYLPKEAGE